MYWTAKFLEASGLAFLAYAFVRTFPEKLNYRVFGVSILLFVSGWIIERYLLKR
jgi:hypothetical protein